jgi:excinuclease ABC subunit B
MDADKQGFLRSERSLIQIIGRCARNVNGHVLMYADKVSDAMSVAIRETNRRRTIQAEYNEKHGIVPTTIKKDIRELISNQADIEIDKKASKAYNKKENTRLIKQIEEEMVQAAKELDFERATELRDIMFELKAERS